MARKRVRVRTVIWEELCLKYLPFRIIKLGSVAFLLTFALFIRLQDLGAVSVSLTLLWRMFKGFCHIDT